MGFSSESKKPFNQYVQYMKPDELIYCIENPIVQVTPEIFKELAKDNPTSFNTIITVLPEQAFASLFHKKHLI